MTSSAGAVAAGVVSDPLALLAEAPLSEEEQGYVAVARAVNTVRGYPKRLGRVVLVVPVRRPRRLAR